MALRRVDDHLQGFVHKASEALLQRIDVAAKDVAIHIEQQAKDIEQGFYGLVARESVDAELRCMVDRAIQRLQNVSNDLSRRSCALQAHIVHAERRLEMYVRKVN